MSAPEMPKEPTFWSKGLDSGWLYNGFDYETTSLAYAVYYRDLAAYWKAMYEQERERSGRGSDKQPALSAWAAFGTCRGETKEGG